MKEQITRRGGRCISWELFVWEYRDEADIYVIVNQTMLWPVITTFVSLCLIVYTGLATDSAQMSPPET